MLPYRKKHRSDDERPLTLAEITAFLAAAGGGNAEVFDLTAMVRRLLPNKGRPRPSIRLLERADRAIFRMLPPLKRWATRPTARA